MTRPFIVAIDGPAGSGKSTVARRVAQQLDFVYVDTGAIYRSVALMALRQSLDLDDGEALAQLAGQIKIRFICSPDGQKVLIDDEDCTQAIRGPEASMAASQVAKQAALRGALLDLQRRLATRDNDKAGAVLEGRDIGSVVFSDAECKIFLVASIEERATRRHKELLAKGSAPPLEQLIDEIRERDANDSQREAAPLLQTEDAVALDTTTLDIDQVVQQILREVDKKRE